MFLISYLHDKYLEKQYYSNYKESAKKILAENNDWQDLYDAILNEEGEWHACCAIIEKYFDMKERVRNPNRYYRKKAKDREHWEKENEKIEKYNKQVEALRITREKEAMQNEIREQILASKDNAIQCPYCKSWDTEKISTASRVTSVALVGVASGKIGKEWHCNKCGSNF